MILLYSTDCQFVMICALCQFIHELSKIQSLWDRVFVVFYVHCVSLFTIASLMSGYNGSHFVLIGLRKCNKTDTISVLTGLRKCNKTDIVSVLMVNWICSYRRFSL
jgi:uncharacterized protein YcsI (UPF0317 family)